MKFSQGSDFSAFSIRHWETVSPLCFSLPRSHTTHLLARSLASLPLAPGNEVREGGGSQRHFPPLSADGQMYFTYFIPSFLPGVTLKPCAAITAAEEHNGEGGVRNGIPLAPSWSESESVGRSCCHRTRDRLPTVSSLHFQQSLRPSRSLARGGLKGREGERRRVGWLVFCAATI